MAAAVSSITFFGSVVLLSKNSHESKFTYNPVQNEAIFGLEKIMMKLSLFKKGQKYSQESKFIYNTV